MSVSRNNDSIVKAAMKMAFLIQFIAVLVEKLFVEVNFYIIRFHHYKFLSGYLFFAALEWVI